MDNEKELEATSEEIKEEESKNEVSTSGKDDVERKIKRQIEKKEIKNEKLGIYTLLEYVKTEHKWENFLFLFLSVLIMVLGGIILTRVLVVNPNIPFIGKYPDAFGWILIGVGFISLIYSVVPFYKPAVPEFKKITWLTPRKFIADSIRVFTFIIVLVALFVLYDSLITGILRLIF